MLAVDTTAGVGYSSSASAIRRAFNPVREAGKVAAVVALENRTLQHETREFAGFFLPGGA